MYVAATRSRDHLVLSLYRTARDQKSRAALIAALMEDADDLWRPASIAQAPAPVVTQETESAEPDDTPEARQQWIEDRAQLLRERARPSSVAATALAQVVKDEADSPEEPWRRGRAGTSIGRAVHSTLQTIDLATGEGLEETARAQAIAEGVGTRTGEVRRLVQQGAVTRNGETVIEFASGLQANDEIRVGRHRFLRIVAADSEPGRAAQ